MYMKQIIKDFLKKQSLLMKLFRTVKTGSAFKPAYSKTIKGTNNKLNFHSSALFIDCKINITGNNNEIVVKDTTLLTNVIFYIHGNNNRIEISNNVLFNQSCTLWM